MTSYGSMLSLTCVLKSLLNEKVQTNEEVSSHLTHPEYLANAESNMPKHVLLCRFKWRAHTRKHLCHLCSSAVPAWADISDLTGQLSGSLSLDYISVKHSRTQPNAPRAIPTVFQQVTLDCNMCTSSSLRCWNDWGSFSLPDLQI